MVLTIGKRKKFCVKIFGFFSNKKITFKFLRPILTSIESFKDSILCSASMKEKQYTMLQKVIFLNITLKRVFANSNQLGLSKGHLVQFSKYVPNLQAAK